MVYYSIAIDGPAASGKSSVAKSVAKKLNFEYINSGSFYRIVAYCLLKNNLPYLRACDISQKFLDSIKLKWDSNIIYIDGVDVTTLLKANKVSQVASSIAVFPNVRQFVNDNIKKLTDSKSIVIDGRDIGTNVLPDATLKVFLTANVKIRAHRRLKELIFSNNSTDLDVVTNELIERDNRDISREIAPLKKAHDAFFIDNSNMSFLETVNEVIKLYMGEVIGVEWTPVDEL